MKAEQLSDILSLSRTCYKASVSSKKKCMELIAQTISNEMPHIQSHSIFDALIERERLGSTGIGHGCALPHCRVQSTQEAIGVLILLNDPIDFDSVDSKPVDIIFALIVPEQDVQQHLELLAKIAEKFSDSEYRDVLRSCDQREALFKLAVAL